MPLPDPDLLFKNWFTALKVEMGICKRTITVQVLVKVKGCKMTHVEDIIPEVRVESGAGVDRRGLGLGRSSSAVAVGVEAGLDVNLNWRGRS